MPALTRRDLLAAGPVAATLAWSAPPVFASTGAAAPRDDGKRFPVRAVSSANGLAAVKRTHDRIVAGADPLDAAVEGVGLVEADPDDTTVGLGGLPNEEGVVELDAAVMHGPTHSAGAVASLRNVVHPARVADLVRRRSDHVLLVGEGALRFARAHGVPEQDLLTDNARRQWLRWKENLSDADDWLPERADDDRRTGAFPRTERTTGTIHLSAMNAAGDVACTTTTSGLAFKIPGRVGDSPIIGAGLYCEHGVGSCGSTGRGEANLQNLCSFAAVELMRGGATPRDAGLEVLRRVAATSPARLRDADGRPTFGLKFYLLAADGTPAGVTMWGPAEYAVCDADGARLEDCAALYERTP